MLQVAKSNLKPNDNSPKDEDSQNIRATASPTDSYTIEFGDNVWLPTETSDCTVLFVDQGPVDQPSDGCRMSESLRHRLSAGAESANAPPSTPLESDLNVVIGRNTSKVRITARGIVTKCNSSKWHSVTLRFPKKLKDILPKTDDQSDTSQQAWADLKNTAPRGYRAQKFDPDFFLQIDSIADVILQSVFEATQSTHANLSAEASVVESPLNVKEKSGVLIFAGATKCGKSQAATATLLRYLYGLPQFEGLPRHLVTAEDPIETLRLYKARGKTDEFGKRNYNEIIIGPTSKSERWVDNTTPLQHGFSLTSRHIGKDVPSLHYVYKNALRQTPACVFVGETREPDDWKTILELGSTGHLVVTTMHAGSITEAMNRIMEARNATTAFSRVSLARTILGICHMRSSERANPSGAPRAFGDRIILPALWYQTSASISAFGTDGLASMVPNPDYLIGRHAFAQSALTRAHVYKEESAYKQRLQKNKICIKGPDGSQILPADDFLAAQQEMFRICRQLDLTEL